MTMTAILAVGAVIFSLFGLIAIACVRLSSQISREEERRWEIQRMEEQLHQDEEKER